MSDSDAAYQQGYSRGYLLGVKTLAEKEDRIQSLESDLSAAREEIAGLIKDKEAILLIYEAQWKKAEERGAREMAEICAPKLLVNVPEDLMVQWWRERREEK